MAKAIKVLVVEVSGNQYVREVRSLADAQNIVGGYIERIGFPNCEVYFNEEGIALDLFPNKFITEFLNKELDKVGKVVLTQGGSVLGTAFITGPTDSKGDWTDVPFEEMPRE